MKQIPILLYHWFREHGTPSTSKAPQLEITPELFKRQLKFLRRNGFEGISLKEALSDQRTSALPPKPVIISIDDGSLDFWQMGKPALDACGFRATVFIVSKFVGQQSQWDQELGEPPRPLMSWDQIRELQENGFEIGAHTHSHKDLTKLSEMEIQRELSDSRQCIEDHIGTTPRYLAYPRGFYNDRIKQMVREAGYKGACGVILKWRHLLGSDPFAIKRMPIKGTESMRRFKLRLKLAAQVPFRQKS